VEPVQVTDMDGFDTSAATVAGFHGLGQRTICYIDVGTWESWRPDAGEFPSSVLGSSDGWPGEQWLDIRQLSVLEPIMTARFEMCQQKGFDAVEPDNMDGDENATGFPISAAQQLIYDTWIAQEVHSLGMAVFEKNDPDQASQLEPYFDGVIDEQCNQFSQCSSYRPYLSAGKPVLNAEYETSLYPGFCAADDAAGIMGALYASALDGSVYEPCFGPSTPSAPVSSASPTATPATRVTTRSGIGSAPARVIIRSSLVTVRHHAVVINLECPSERSLCAGMLELDAVKRPQRARKHGGSSPLVLGGAHFHIVGGRSRPVRVELARRALSKLSLKWTTIVLVTAVAREAGDQVPAARRTVKLKLGA